MRSELMASYRQRVEKFIDHLCRHQTPLVATVPLEARYCRTVNPVPFDQRLQERYRRISAGDAWGEAWDSAWFHLQGKIPEQWDGQEVVACLNFNGEACVFDPSGCPVYGLTSRSVFAHEYDKEIFCLTPRSRGGDEIELWVEAAANHLFGIQREADPARDCPQRHGRHQGRVVKMELALFDRQLWQLLLDLEVMLGLMKGLHRPNPAEKAWGKPNKLPAASPRVRRILHTLNRAIDAFADNRANAAKARQIIAELNTTPANASDCTAVAVGHAHIDTGWLWPVSETVRKCARTFASQIALLEKYPEYVFGASQPQHYQFVKQHYPLLYEKIKGYVKEGRWELQGGMWVEADCNLISGESMVRQFLHGKNFFRDEFNLEVKNLWIPDVFGYPASMPQIMRKAGVDFFVTQKMSWSQFNQFPFTTFRWRGIDGSEVLTHFPPEDSYNSELSPQGLIAGQENFKESHLTDRFLSLFGIGNGGGGPKEDHIEQGRRLADLEGAPKVEFGRADTFLDQLAEHRDQFEVWNGELYLEIHRGTLTTQARTKKGNRTLERKLREVEFVYAAMAPDKYPAAALDRLWKTLLINQFHDILPGSSIRAVYETTEKEYAEAIAECDQWLAKAATCENSDDSLTLVNPLACTFAGTIALPASWQRCGTVEVNGKTIPCQAENDHRTVASIEIPPCSAVELIKCSGKPTRHSPTPNPADQQELILENHLIRYVFNQNGELSSAFDKELECELIAPDEPGNRLSLYIDRPVAYDAWDIDISYENELHSTAVGQQTAFLPDGPVRRGLQFQLRIGDSHIEQFVYLENNRKRLDFHTRVDWRELHKMLRVSFPLTIRSDQASFDIQFGNYKRPTHRNTCWDLARFEVLGHKYADLSGQSHGVALLNDCKYGYKVSDHVIDLNLLRAPTHPDPDADLGHHEFAYAFLPHRGTLEQSEAIEEAARFNQPPIALAGATAANFKLPFAIIKQAGVSLEACKKAEKEDCLVIRLVETRGDHARPELQLAEGWRMIPCDLLEWNEENNAESGRVKLKFDPFEIKTYKIYHLLK